MAKQFSQLNDTHRKFIDEQHLFFVGTADKEGRVNVSPKGMDSLRIIDNNRVIWLNLTGSGNETAAHLLAENRITIMFCSFSKKPLILRLYGTGKAIYPNDNEWKDFTEIFPAFKGSRQFFDIKIDLVQTSCGFAVPFYEYKGERNLLLDWADKIGEEGIKDYWHNRNRISIDGKDTGI